MHKESSSRAMPWFHKLWHGLDNIRWMDPLPAPHRRGILLALVIMLLAFLWPSATPQYPVERPVSAQQNNSDNRAPIQANLDDRSSPDHNNSQAPASPPAQPADRGQWRNFQIASGQTLAQLFRDNNLQVSDVFAMAQVEGDDKPLSNLHSGQQVKVRQDAQGVVTGLTIDTDNGPVLFTRQPDGSFIRAQ
ncbi:Opacity-associated protein A [Paramixta manurensis]|uniref:Opacity-associated protein A n=1 Tax=Paramixta manurensis TaxID=2740817 RepID=A0A6M8UK40_9GAMM|nr:Opacity-associated protein A [Erwiniaceae bacterium PD-1]